MNTEEVDSNRIERATVARYNIIKYIVSSKTWEHVKSIERYINNYNKLYPGLEDIYYAIIHTEKKTLSLKKLIKTIKSCTTISHIISVSKMVNNFNTIYPGNFTQLNDFLIKQRSEIKVDTNSSQSILLNLNNLLMEPEPINENVPLCPIPNLKDRYNNDTVLSVMNMNK